MSLTRFFSKKGGEDIEDLKSDSGWLSIDIGTGYTLRYRKIGKVVQLKYWTEKGCTVNSVIATLPEGYRPSVSGYPENMRAPDCYAGLSDSNTYIINANGELFSTKTISNSWTGCHMMYFAS